MSLKAIGFSVAGLVFGVVLAFFVNQIKANYGGEYENQSMANGFISNMIYMKDPRFNYCIAYSKIIGYAERCPCESIPPEILITAEITNSKLP